MVLINFTWHADLIDMSITGARDRNTQQSNRQRMNYHIDALVQGRRNCDALAVGLLSFVH